MKSKTLTGIATSLLMYFKKMLPVAAALSAAMLVMPTGLKAAEAVLKVNVDKDRYVVEAAVPLAALGLKPTPGLTLRGDLGVTHADLSGVRTRLRSYWANQQTGLVDDVVFELQLTPKNWGEISFK